MSPDSIATVPVSNPDPNWQARHARNLGLSQRSTEVLLLGDSITANWDAVPATLRSSTGTTSVANFGIQGDRTEHILWRLQSGEGAGTNPKAILLMIGTNNAGAGNQSEFDVFLGTQAVVGELRRRFPEARILIQAILPRGAQASDPLRREIAAANDLVIGLRDGQRVFVQNFSRSFVAPNGTLRTNLFLPDMIHPNANGYAVWARAVKRNLALMRVGRNPVDIIR
ncbi:MAG: hypothetical protein JNJ45_00505 [Chthonomonas sp.]|nr:hypothetical protein [Chthonomonas sp.]